MSEVYRLVVVPDETYIMKLMRGNLGTIRREFLLNYEAEVKEGECKVEMISDTEFNVIYPDGDVIKTCIEKCSWWISINGMT